MSVASDYRAKKETYFGKKLPGYSAYIYAFVPILIAASVWNLVTIIKNFNGDAIHFVLAIAWVLLSVLAEITAIDGDAPAFWCNIIFLVFLLANNVIYQAISVIGAVSDVSGAVSNVASGAGDMASIITASAGIGTALVVVPTAVTLILLLAFCAYYLALFIGHKSYFLTPYDDLKKAYRKSMSEDEEKD